MAIIASEGYRVVTGSNSLNALDSNIKRAKPTSLFILCDDNTLKCCLPVLVTACPSLESASVIEVDHGEGSKSLDHASQIWQTLADEGADRHAIMINLGGGVISDLGGFCSSVYMRGISYVNLPTSLLAMADASVGAKTAIDFGGVKNLIGTFAPPSGVFVNAGFLNTLPVREYQNGMAEVMKIALVADKKLWEDLSLEMKVERMIERSIRLKNGIVTKDPRDKGLRQSLNFGHTIGHAIEAAYMPNVLHGEAVAMGMIVETYLSNMKGALTTRSCDEINRRLHQYFRSCMIKIDPAALWNFIRNDKKRSGEAINCTLLSGIGKCRMGVKVSVKDIQKAIELYNSQVP